VTGELVLTGNPYPSAIDLSFLLDATNTGIAYFLGTGQNDDSHYIADYKGGYGTFFSIGW
jgi:hypothetical protein